MGEWSDDGAHHGPATAWSARREDGGTGDYDATMAKPLIPTEVILTRALELLDADGLEALTVRRLSADLKISPRTLYQQVGNQEALIRALVARHFSQLKLDFREYDTWEATALQWCLALRDTLRRHPFITELITMDDRRVVTEYVEALLSTMRHGGVPRPLAVACCRGLTNMTINHAIVEAKTLREAHHSPETTAEVTKIDREFPRLVQWVIAAVRTEADAMPQPHSARRGSPSTARKGAR